MSFKMRKKYFEGILLLKFCRNGMAYKYVIFLGNLNYSKNAKMKNIILYFFIYIIFCGNLPNICDLFI